MKSTDKQTECKVKKDFTNNSDGTLDESVIESALQEVLKKFDSDRNYSRFYAPKDIISSLIGEDDSIIDINNWKKRVERSYDYEVSAPSALKECLCEIRGEYQGRDKTTGVLILKNAEETYEVEVTSDTISSFEYCIFGLKTGTKLSVIAIEKLDHSGHVAVILMTQEEMSKYENVNLPGRVLAIRDIFAISKGDKEKRTFLESALLENSVLETRTCNNYFFDKDKFKSLYSIRKSSFPIETQREIEWMLRDPEASKHHCEQRLRMILSISPVCTGRIMISRKELQERFNAKFCKQDSAKQMIIDVIISRYRAKKRGVNLLFVGSPGTGKSDFAEIIARELHLPCECISLAGCEHMIELSGSDPGYDNACPGQLARACFHYSTSEMVFCLDGLDKVNSDSNEGDPMGVLRSALEGRLEDKFLGCPISTENTIFVGTCCSLDSIPKDILDRFVIIRFDDYSDENKLAIAKNYIIPELQDKYNITESDITFDDETLLYIIQNFCEGGGVRDLKSYIEIIMRRCIDE